MVYLFYQSWKNTDANHAGMKYMCNKLAELYPEKYKSIEVVESACGLSGKSFLTRGINRFFRPVLKFLRRRCLQNIANNIDLNDNDTVVLTEYMDKNVGHIEIAKVLRKKFKTIKIFGISHLVPEKLNCQFEGSDMSDWTAYVDGLITLGHSLTDYYIGKGISKNKILTTFHYVDNYYLNDNLNSNLNFRVLVQGNQMRDLDKLIEIVKNNQDIQFIVCQGLCDLSLQLNYSNVKLLPFLTEDQLRYTMSECPVSLNVMKDTIGSNVIVTSMGMGQAMVCSDVGSIRDYCNDYNCRFCTSVSDFSHALQNLLNNDDELNSLRQNSRLLANKFVLKNFEEELFAFIQ